MASEKIQQAKIQDSQDVLVADALNQGGRDNVSVVVVESTQLPPEGVEAPPVKAE